MKSFLNFLQESFNELGEYGGIPIIKDNCDDLFDAWLEKKDLQEVIDLAEIYGKECYLEGKQNIINNIKSPHYNANYPQQTIVY